MTSTGPHDDVVVVVGPRPRLQGGVATHIRTLLSGGLSESFRLVHLEVGFWDEPASRWKRIADALRKIAQLRSLLKRHPGALVHLNPSMDTRSFVRDLPMLWVASRRGSPVLVQFHGGLMDRPRASRGRLGRSIVLRSLRRADLLLVLSRLQEESITRAFGPGNGLTVEHVPALYLDVAPFEERVGRRAGSGPVRSFVFVGRIAKEKGIGELLEALRDVREKGSGVALHVVGSGPDEDLLESACRSLGLGDAVTWHGYVAGDPKLDLLAAADAFVLPSWSEGLPNALVEAFAAGLPVVVSGVGAMAEVVEDGVNGFVVPPRDARALAAAMSRLLESPDEARAMGRRNAAVARERFSLERQVEAFGAIYERVRARHAGR